MERASDVPLPARQLPRAGRLDDRPGADHPGLDAHTAHVMRFYTKQFVDAMAPSNFVFTNPEVLRTTIESDGENLVRGLDHLLEDIERGNGELLVKMTDYEAFEVGHNVAVT